MSKSDLEWRAEVLAARDMAEKLHALAYTAQNMSYSARLWESASDAWRDVHSYIESAIDAANRAIGASFHPDHWQPVDRSDRPCGGCGGTGELNHGSDFAVPCHCTVTDAPPEEDL